MKKLAQCVSCLAIALLLATNLQPVAAQEADAWLDKNIESLTKMYVHFHKNPELSFQEEKTGLRVGEELKKVGCKVTQNVGGFGVVGIMENGEGPTVMVRADMDALPVVERTGRPYASNVQVEDADGATVGVMHACGHDIHMTSMLGTAKFLAENKAKWSGTIVFIGQPAEERGSGANAMLKDGLFEKFPKPDYCLALHVAANIPVGKIAMRPGYTMANVDSVDVTLFGRGGHGAYPHTTIDPVVEAAKFVLDVQTIVSREVKPTEAAVITVGSIHAGTKHNIISDQCHLQLTVRSYSDDVRKHLLDAIKRKAKAAATSVGAKEPKIEISEGTPSLNNDAGLVARIQPAMQKAIGEANVTPGEQVMGGEDFSQYSRQGGMPGVLFWLGVVDQARLDRYTEMDIPSPSLHSAEFYPEIEPSLRIGIKTMGSAVLELMPKK